MRRLASALLSATILTAACAPGDTPSEPVTSPTGRLVIIGGGLDAENAAVYQTILEARDGDGPMCVVPTAAGSPKGSMESMVERLDGYGGEGTGLGIPISTETPGLAYDSATVAQIGTCSGFYFTGGAQSRVVNVFLPQGDTTPAYRAVWDRWQGGAVVAGSSAGAAMMSQVMIAGGSPASAVANGLATEEDSEGIDITHGMGFFTRTILDQHFLARGRIGRSLVAALLTDSVPVSLGIDENTALVVDGSTGTVVGASGVVVVDARNAKGRGSIRGAGVQVTLAGAGDVVDLTTFQVRRDPAKQPVPADGPAVTLPEDPLARWAFLHLMVDMASSSDIQAVFALGDVTLIVTEAPGFSAVMTAPGGGVQETPLGFSAGPWLVDLRGSGDFEANVDTLRPLPRPTGPSTTKPGTR